MSEISEEEKFDAKVVKLMKMAGGPGDPSHWTQNQIFYGLGESCVGVTKKDVEDSIKRLLFHGAIAIVPKFGHKQVQYYVLYNSTTKYPRESEEDFRDNIFDIVFKIRSSQRGLEGRMTHIEGNLKQLQDQVDALQLFLIRDEEGVDVDDQ